MATPAEAAVNDIERRVHWKSQQPQWERSLRVLTATFTASSAFWLCRRSKENPLSHQGLFGFFFFQLPALRHIAASSSRGHSDSVTLNCGCCINKINKVSKIIGHRL